MPGAALATLLLAAATAAAAAGELADGRFKKRKRLGKKKGHCSKAFTRDVRHFFGAILGPVRPSVPCCLVPGAALATLLLAAATAAAAAAAGRFKKAEKVS